MGIRNIEVKPMKLLAEYKSGCNAINEVYKNNPRFATIVELENMLLLFLAWIVGFVMAGALNV